ncbi:MAG: Isoaspartyl peptidase/L-asparaginase precursor [Syntrophorhabdaceae bacterium PtaU1.Bin034]|jgi:L-asparaginase/beta-aspartyl-peptidase (threonine type)|nr:MAG: Isoaspartyl peptidase/L-asparaginase precursor [Syntrophorhabdaceae bacterium PtaU1.Bin034]
MISYGVVAHGGVGTSKRLSGGCKIACQKALTLLEKGGQATEAAIEAVRVLEDDGRFNAGSGSTLRLDGKTVEMDASVMDSQGRLGIVIAVQDVKNPVLLARAIIDTPHVALAGPGATILARRAGLDRALPVSERALKRYDKTRRSIKEGRLRKGDTRWKETDIHRVWNFELPYEHVFPLDTVGAVALDKAGNLAVASSTGGASPMMLGRVGDTAMAGCGFYAGPAAALAATGIGEEIIRKMLAKTVYDLVCDGQEIDMACEEGLHMFPPAVPIGIIALSKAGFAIRANRQMAVYNLIKEA